MEAKGRFFISVKCWQPARCQVEAVMLNRCVPTDSYWICTVGCSWAATEWQVGVVSYACCGEDPLKCVTSLWHPVYCPFGGWKTPLCFLSSTATMKPYFYDPVQSLRPRCVRAVNHVHREQPTRDWDICEERAVLIFFVCACAHTNKDNNTKDMSIRTARRMKPLSIKLTGSVAIYSPWSQAQHHRGCSGSALTHRHRRARQ